MQSPQTPLGMAQSRRIPGLRGYFDLISDNEVRGWLCDAGDMSNRLRIDAFLNSDLIVSVSADGGRKSRLPGEFGSGYYGFRFGRSLLGRKVKTVSDLNLFIAGTNILLRPGEGGSIVGQSLLTATGSDAEWLGRTTEDTDIIVTIEHEAARIGDTLTTLAFIHHLHERFGQPIHVDGKFSDAVRDLVCDTVISSAPPIRMQPLHFRLNIIAARDIASPLGLHACQGFFLLADMALPRLPVRLELHVEPCGQAAGVVIAPFTTTKRNEPDYHKRTWNVEGWRKVIHYLTIERGISNIYVIGSLNDDFAPFEMPGVTHISDWRLPKVLDLMRRALLCITLDNGMSHLAHFGDVGRHLLLYPRIHRPNLVRNHRGLSIYKEINDISVDDVINGIQMLMT